MGGPLPGQCRDDPPVSCHQYCSDAGRGSDKEDREGVIRFSLDGVFKI